MAQAIAKQASIEAARQAAEAQKAAGEKLLGILAETMKTVEPVTREATKVSQDLGQLMLKTIVTLNGGAVIGFPAFYKSLAPTDAPVSPAFLNAFRCFAGGVGLAGIGVVVAFAIGSWVARMTVNATLAPLLEAQANLFPDKMDKTACKRLTAARRGIAWGPRIALIMNIGIALMGAAALTLFIVGGFYGEHAVSALVTTRRP